MGLLAAGACQQVSGQDCYVASVQTAVKWNEGAVCVCLNRFCTTEQQRFSKEGRESEEALINAAQSGIQQGRKAGR